MIQIDMPMPERCGVCFAMHTDEIGLESWCGIDETARDLYTADINTKRPEWCPLQEKEAVEPKVEKAILDYQSWHYICGDCGGQIDINDNYCRHCGRVVEHLSNKI